MEWIPGMYSSSITTVSPDGTPATDPESPPPEELSNSTEPVPHAWWRRNLSTPAEPVACGYFPNSGTKPPGCAPMPALWGDFCLSGWCFAANLAAASSLPSKAVSLWELQVESVNFLGADVTNEQGRTVGRHAAPWALNIYEPVDVSQG